MLSFSQPFQVGANISSSISDRRERGRLLAQQQVQAKNQAEQLRRDLTLLDNSESVSAADIAKVSARNPQLREVFSDFWDNISTERQQSTLNQGTNVLAALNAGNNEVALDLLNTQAEAAQNSGDDAGARSIRLLMDNVQSSPATAKTNLGLQLSAMMGPDKFIETFTKLEADRRATAGESTKLTKAQADAKKASTAAKFAESEAAQSLQKTGWDIQKIQQDVKISRQNAKIAAMQAAESKEADLLKREDLQLKIDAEKRKRDNAVREKAAEVESSRSNIDNMINTLDRVAQTDESTIRAATGPVDAKFPTLLPETANFEELIKTVDAQSFLAQVPNMTGLGALSDAEGAKLSAALQSFSLRQSPERLLENVKEAQRLLIKGRKNLALKHGVPDTIPDTPAVDVNANEISDILKIYGVDVLGDGE